MATHREVMAFLRPNGGYICVGTDYEGIEFLECEPFTKKEYGAAFAAYDAKKAEEDAALEAKKLAAEAKLAALGLNAEDLKVLGLA